MLLSLLIKARDLDPLNDTDVFVLLPLLTYILFFTSRHPTLSTLLLRRASAPYTSLDCAMLVSLTALQTSSYPMLTE